MCLKVSIQGLDQRAKGGVTEHGADGVQKGHECFSQQLALRDIRERRELAHTLRRGRDGGGASSGRGRRGLGGGGGRGGSSGGGEGLEGVGGGA